MIPELNKAYTATTNAPSEKPRAPTKTLLAETYRGYIGIMEKKMETTLMENQMEKKMQNEMETVDLPKLSWHPIEKSCGPR